MKIKFKKILKLFIGLMSPLLVGLSVVPIITSCSKSEEGLLPPGADGTIGELDASEEFIKNVNGKNALIVPYKYLWTRFSIEPSLARDHNITTLYLPVGKYIMEILSIYINFRNDDPSDYCPIEKINWYDGFDKNGNPNVVDPSHYKVGTLGLYLNSTYISSLGNLPKSNSDIYIEAMNSALVTLDFTGHKDISLGSFKNSKNLRSIKIDKDAELDGIKDYNFYGCSINQPLIFPKNMNLEYSDNEYEKMTIGYRAFRGKNNTFTDVYFYGDESNYKISESAFNPGVRLHYNYEG